MDIIKRRDTIISIAIILFTILLVFLIASEVFLDFSSNNMLLSGFIKFFILATIGEVIGLRMKMKKWIKPNYLIIRAIIWGFIGIVIVLMFEIFSNGTLHLQSINVLPFGGSTFAFAIFTSILINVIFAPTMMIFHKITDSYLELRLLQKKASIIAIIKYIQWDSFFKIIIFKTIPLFWIPAHTITFLLPSEYRIIFAALLGIFLGVILSIFNSESSQSKMNN